jgi:hypothetical protein
MWMTRSLFGHKTNAPPRPIRVAEFLDHMNAQSPCIKFTIEFKNEYKLAFLDFLIESRGDKLATSVYQKKKQILENTVIFVSNHPYATKTGIVNSLFSRAKTRYSDK